MKHTFHPDKYVFEDVNRRTRETSRDDWTWTKHDGKRVWAYKGKKTTYISDIEIK